MLNCIIEEVLEYNTYKLKSEEKSFLLVLELYGVNKPKAGDKLTISEKLIDETWEGYTQPYAFELTESKQLEEQEFILLQTANKNYFLKRIYG